MKTVWKFALTVRGHYAHMQMPVGAKVVHAGKQDGIPTLWAVVDVPGGGMLGGPMPEPITVEHRVFFIAGTGHQIDPLFTEHLGTYFDGPYVWHVFEQPRP